MCLLFLRVDRQHGPAGQHISDARQDFQRCHFKNKTRQRNCLFVQSLWLRNCEELLPGMCFHFTIEGNFNEDAVELNLCTCYGLNTTSDIKALLMRLAQRMELQMDGSTLRLTTEGSTSQTLRELMDNYELQECLPPGGKMLFYFM